MALFPPIAAAWRRHQQSGRPLPASEATTPSDRRERPESGVEYPRRRPALMLAGLCLALAAPLAAQRGRGGGIPRDEMHPPAVRPMRPPPERNAAQPAPGRGPALGVGLEQLAQLPPGQREQRLRQDPGFQNLPPQRQQQLLRQLQRLNAMPPGQQQRLIQRLHDLGELNPQQRAGLADIYRQFQGMTPDRRRAFRVAYNNLRVLPPEQRELRLNSPQFQSRFSPDEVHTLRQALSLDLPADVVGARPGGGLL